MRALHVSAALLTHILCKCDKRGSRAPGEAHGEEEERTVTAVCFPPELYIARVPPLDTRATDRLGAIEGLPD